MAKKKARTAYRTAKGTKRYLKRDAKGRITDNQSYKKAHGADVRRKSKAEAEKGRGDCGE